MSVPLEEMSGRWAKLRKAMSDEGLGGLLVFANQINTVALHYCAGYTLFGDRAFCYLPLSGQPVLLISEAWDRDRAVKETLFADVRVLGKNWHQEVASLCRSCGGPLGLTGREIMGRWDLAKLEAAMGRETLSATRFLDKMTIFKSPRELELIRDAGKMADAGFMRALEVMREGLPDYQLVAEIDYAMRRMGATDNFQMLAIGKQISGMLLPVGKKVARGDLILFEITPANSSVTYSAQLCKTVIFGEPPDKLLREKYQLLIEALEESLLVIKPGVRISEVARIQNAILTKAGYGEYCKPPYMRSRGHSFGLGNVEIDEDSELEFAEGISLVVHPNQFLPETGYLALGENIIVTANGFERLTRTEPKIYECPNL